MWLYTLAVIVGFTILVWGADKFVSGAASLADHLGMSRLLIGLTVVSLGTSAPELLVSAVAAIEGNPMLAVGNAIGSNIVNIGMVLGITAMVVPLPFSQRVLRTELPWLLGATFLCLILLFDLKLSLIDGLILLGTLALMFWRLVHNQHQAGDVATSMNEELDSLPQMNRRQALLWLFFGLVFLLAGARLLVWAAVNIAAGLGVSELVIGLTIVAAGTSLPEFAATLGAAIKGHSDIAIGNVVGSNILNVLGVLAIPGLFGTIDVDSVALWRDAGTMLALTLLLALFAYAIGSRPVITRFEGAILFLAWVGYTVMLFPQA